MYTLNGTILYHRKTTFPTFQLSEVQGERLGRREVPLTARVVAAEKNIGHPKAQKGNNGILRYTTATSTFAGQHPPFQVNIHLFRSTSTFSGATVDDGGSEILREKNPPFGCTKPVVNNGINYQP